MTESPIIEWLEQLSDSDLERMARENPVRFRSLYGLLDASRAGNDSSSSRVFATVGADRLGAQYARVKALADRLNVDVAAVRSAIEVTAGPNRDYGRVGHGRVYTVTFTRATTAVPAVVCHFLVDDVGAAGLIAYASDARGEIDEPTRRFPLDVSSFDAVPEALVGKFIAGF